MSKKETKLESAQRIGRERAYYNRNDGGVLITAEYTGDDHNGNHWRALVDGGNHWNGRLEWIAGRASGGGYDVRACALAQAVRGVMSGEPQELNGDAIDWHNFRDWRRLAAERGWTMYQYGEKALVLIPSATVAEKIKAEIEGRRRHD